MSAFAGFIYKKKRGLIAIILILTSLSMVVMSDKRGIISFKNIGNSFVFPFQFLFNSLGKGVYSTVNSVTEINKVKDELSLAQKELEQYRKIMIDFNVMMNENKSLREKLDLVNTMQYESVTAEVIGHDSKNYFDMLIINKGSSAGVSENMPAISYNNGKKVIIGKIIEVTPFSSKIMTLNNNNLHIGAVLSKDNIHTLVTGDNLFYGYARLFYLPKDVKLNKNEPITVYTSGDSLFYPKGIEIGTLTEINESKRYENYNEGVIKTSVELSKIDYVLILKISPDQQNMKLMENPF